MSSQLSPFYSYSASPRPLPQPPKRRHYGRLFIVLIALGLVAAHLIVPRIDAQPRHSEKPKVVTPLNQQALSQMDGNINTILAANPTIDVSVSIVDLNSGQTRNYGPQVPYEAASVTKLITAVDYAQAVQRGQQHWSTTLEDGSNAAQDFHKMVVNSDNGAWQSLNDQLGLNSLSITAGNIGITDYNLSNNTIMASDIALLLQKLYHGQLLNPTNTQLLLGDMKIANENYLIPPVVPAHVKVYHKAGLLDDRVHDAAIIDNGEHPLILVIFTNGHGTYDFPGRTAIIQSITKAVLAGFGIN